jgi:hypothetical protein
VACVYFVSRKPFDIVNIELKFCFVLDPGLNFFIENFAFILVKSLGKNADNAITLVAFERKEDNERVL